MLGKDSSNLNDTKEEIMSDTTTRTLPRWIVIYAWFMVLVPLAIAAVTVFSPESLFPDLDESALALDGPTGAYAIRNFSAAFAMAFALFRRSPQMLLVMFVLRLATDVPDFIVAVNGGAAVFPFILLMIVVFWGPSAWAVRALWSNFESTRP